jgi:hypothetical protein
VEAIRSAQRTEVGFNAKLLPGFIAKHGVTASEIQIRDILTHLHEEGNIYYTVDGEYVKLTDDNWTL